MIELTPAEALAKAEIARDAAERANRAKTRFLAAASHDLRQPLQALRLLNAALQEHLQADDVAKNILQDSERALEVMGRLLGSLLDISKIESGGLTPERRHFTVAGLFNDLRGEFQLLAKEKNLRFTVLPSRAVIFSDRLMIEAILRNLLANALRYTRRGKILLSCRRKGDFAHIEVWDTGVGIPEDKFNFIFDEFYRLSNPDGDISQGLGLGLSIVRGYARLLGHPVRVRSRMNEGSVFSLEIPLGDPTLTHEIRQDRVNAGASWDLHGMKALLIEDDQAALEAMQRLLGLWGMQVIGVASGAEARDMLSQHRFIPDIVITDYRLPGGETGVDAIDRIAPMIPFRTPVIFVTGDSVTEVRAALRGRFTHLLQKPLPPAKLRALLRNLRRDHVAGG